jgi:nucleoid-associated protein EbfC
LQLRHSAAILSASAPVVFDLNLMTNFQQLFQLGQQVQARLSQLQTELGNRTITTSSGGGMVNVTADGKGRVRQLRIDPSVVDPNDVEMLEDLIVAAVTEAQQRAEQVYEEEMKKVAGGLPLPFNLPNFP